MKSLRILITTILVGGSLALFVGACGHSEQGHHHDTEAADAHHHADMNEPLQLNNGERWEADDHTRRMVSEMKQTVSAYEQSGEDNYRVLGDSLTNQLNRLIVGCTMEGPAHDELHKWLGPLTQNVKELSTVKGPAGVEPVHEIEASLGDFDQYFK